MVVVVVVGDEIEIGVRKNLKAVVVVSRGAVVEEMRGGLLMAADTSEQAEKFGLKDRRY